MPMTPQSLFKSVRRAIYCLWFMLVVTLMVSFSDPTQYPFFFLWFSLINVLTIATYQLLGIAEKQQNEIDLLKAKLSPSPTAVAEDEPTTDSPSD